MTIELSQIAVESQARIAWKEETARVALRRAAEEAGVSYLQIRQAVLFANWIARPRGVEMGLTPNEWLEILVASDGRCYHCGEKKGLNRLTMDHLIPTSRGGPNTKENVVAACAKCNIKKGNRLGFVPANRVLGWQSGRFQPIRINISEFRQQMWEMAQLVEVGGQEVIITRGGTALFKLVPPSDEEKRAKAPPENSPAPRPNCLHPAGSRTTGKEWRCTACGYTERGVK